MTVELKPGDPAPEFKLEDGEGKTWQLSELAGTRVVLYFYPADDTPGCTAESCDFRDNYQAFKDANTEILGVSPQGAASHQKFAQKYSLSFPLLIDQDLETAAAYGAVADKSGEWEGIPIKIKRSTFVIGADGNIEQAIYGVKVKGHVDALKESLSS
ncbi:MAG: thioredoxin-dependent peroxiredoxin [Actinomycetota bacterium]|jgi:peroxiredoxin Q/BCP|nr:thioredoxin-dependent peroxiredoxin [Actinomycetota bacterium]